MTTTGLLICLGAVLLVVCALVIPVMLSARRPASGLLSHRDLNAPEHGIPANPPHVKQPSSKQDRWQQIRQAEMALAQVQRSMSGRLDRDATVAERMAYVALLGYVADLKEGKDVPVPNLTSNQRSAMGGAMNPLIQAALQNRRQPPQPPEPGIDVTDHPLFKKGK